jgi:hypothetical protein
MKSLFAILLSGALLAACGWRPPQFADREPVTEVHDDRPISTPRIRTFIEEFYQADVYVRRELVNGLDPRSYPQALDVNSFDRVPKSSWYRGVAHDHHPLIDYRRDGPPQPPFQLTGEPPSSDSPDAISITDARGLPYELQPDVTDRPGMRTGAAVIASRLVHALGYRTPEVYIARSHTGQRVAATRWPIGVDLGPTPIQFQRPDDPNDHLPHVDRRSLRALKLVTAWLDIVKMRPRMLRDAFVGKNAQGHVQHFILGLDSAIGVETYLRAVKFAEDPDREDSNFFLRVFSLGLSPKAPGVLPRTVWPSVGLFHERLLPAKFSSSPPFEPMDRLQPGDLYWIAKRIASVPMDTIVKALEDAELEPGPVNYIFQVLHLRRAAIVAWGYDRTTPCELLSIEKKAGRRVLVLADLAIETGFVEADERSYTIGFYDSNGDEISNAFNVQASSSIVRIPLPEGLDQHPYVVARILARRDDHPMARPFDVHLRRGKGNLQVVGLRH